MEESRNILIYFLAIKCFIYYSGIREDDKNIIEDDVKDSTNNILNKANSRENFENILKNILYYHEEIINYELFKIVQTELLIEDYDLMHYPGKYEVGSKTTIMYDVIRDFMMFSITYLQLSHSSNNKLFYNFLSNFESDRIREYSNYYLNKTNEYDVVNRISEYLTMLPISNRKTAVGTDVKKEIILKEEETESDLKKKNF